MTLAFTLCSNNYLAQAKTLGDSFLKFHPSAKFVIGLVDEFDESVNYQEFEQFTILPVSFLEIPGFQSLVDKFNIVELNTSVKPFYFSYFFEKEKAERIIYLDPDIQVFSEMTELLELQNEHDIILTPQLCEPIDDGQSPTDQTLLITGTFNLGFIALARYASVKTFLDWWTDRIVKYGFAMPERHMFYDQLFINLVPAYFENYYILRHKGYNMAGWNLYERTVTPRHGDEVFINNSIPLRFFHYSGYQFSKPDTICKYNDRFDFISRPDVAPIFRGYHELVMRNGHAQLSKIAPVYKKKIIPTPPVPQISILLKIAYRLKKTTRVLFGME